MVSSIGSSRLHDYLMQLGQAGPASTMQSGSRSSSTSSTKDLFGEIDTDGNGSVSKDEFASFRSNMETQFVNSVMSSRYDTAGAASSTEDLFGKIDGNSDGSISSGEFSTFLSEPGAGTAASQNTGDTGGSVFNTGSIATSSIMNAIGKYMQFAI